MSIEIERKFLVDGEAVKEISKLTLPLIITQGYIMQDEKSNCVLRVRLSAYYSGMKEPRQGYITIKRGIDEMSRHEFEYEIPAKDAEFMLDTMCPHVITKLRRHINVDSNLKWEIDFFLNKELDGLVVAEIELPSKDTEIVLPEWIIEEVTDDPQYLNSNLIGRINT